MRELSDSEKACLRDMTTTTYWHLFRSLLEEAIHRESIQQLECDPYDGKLAARYKARREVLEEIVKAPYELSKGG